MFLKRLALAGLAIGAGLAVAGCNDGYGYGGLDVGYGAPGYGYGGGDGYYGAGYYGDGYGDGGYGGYGYPSYFGWYGDFFYPGTGIYVYDRYRRPYRWNGDQRRYWQGRSVGVAGGGANWNGFNRNPGVRGFRGNPGLAGGAPGYQRGFVGRGNSGAVGEGITPNAAGDANGLGYHRTVPYGGGSFGSGSGGFHGGGHRGRR